MTSTAPTNEEIADVLDRIASLLEVREEGPFRVAAYRDGASTVRSAPQSVADLARDRGAEGLAELPYIGEGLAHIIEEYVEQGRSRLLDELKGEVSAVDLLTQVPGIGRALARRVVEQLEIGSLEELEIAAHDGRLETVEGFGPKRVKTVRMSLAGMLSGAAGRRRQRVEEDDETSPHRKMPPVDLLMVLDREYRRRAARGELRRIAPRRFNPTGEAWLPIMHRSRGEWKFTVLYSNTARAHELGKTDDWVIIYWENQEDGQATVVTATKGDLQGKRVVRGREAECRAFYGS